MGFSSWCFLMGLAICLSGESYGEVAVVLISSDVTVNIGESTVLVCVGFYEPDTSITWMRSGEELSNSSDVSITEQTVTTGITVFLSSFLHLCNVQYNSSSPQKITCVTSNGTNSVNSSVQLQVNGYTRLVGLSNDTSFSTRENAVFACVGQGEPYVDISWRQDGILISNSSRTVILEEYFTQQGSTYKRSYLHLCSQTDICNSFTLQCEVSNGTDLVNGSITVYITDPIELEMKLHSINDTEAVLTCVGSGRSDLSFSWKYNDEVIANTTRQKVTQSTLQVGGRIFTVSYLYLCNLEYCDSGTYSCVIEGCSALNESFEVSIEEGPQIVVLTNNTSVMVGRSIGLVCIGSNANVPSIEWYQNGVRLYNSTKVSIVENVSTQDDGNYWTSSFLTFCEIEVLDDGIITCSAVSNNCSNSSSLALNVIYVPTDVKIFGLSNSTQVQAGRSILLFCDGPNETHVTISWLYAGEEVTNNSQYRITEEAIGSGRNIMRSYLLLKTVQKCTAGNYSCMVSNQTSSVQSAVHVDVQYGEYGIVRISNSTSVDAGDSSTLVCVGFGEILSNVKITWSLDNQLVQNSSEVTIAETFIMDGGRQVKQSALIHEDVQIEDEGMYTCTVSVEPCSVDSTLILSVIENKTTSSPLSPGAVAAVAVIATAGGVAATAGGVAFLAYILKHAKKVKILKTIASKIRKFCKMIKGDDNDGSDNDNDDDQEDNGNEKGKSMKYAKKSKSILTKIIKKIKRCCTSRKRNAQRKARREAASKANSKAKKNGDKKKTKPTKRPSNEYDVPVVPPKSAKHNPRSAEKKTSHDKNGTKKTPHSAPKKSSHNSTDKKVTHKKNLEKIKKAPKKATEIYMFDNTDPASSNDIGLPEEAIYEEID